MKRLLIGVCFASLIVGMYATAAIAEDIEALDWNEPETIANMDEAIDVDDEGDATGEAGVTDQEERRYYFRVYHKRIHPYKGKRVRVRCTAHICGYKRCYLYIPRNWIHWEVCRYGNPITRVPMYVMGKGRGILAVRGAYHLRKYYGRGPTWIPVKWAIPGVTGWRWAPAFNRNYWITCGRKYWLYNGICVLSRYGYLRYPSTKYYDDLWMTLYCRVGADVKEPSDVDTSDAATETPLSDAELQEMSDTIYGMESTEEGTEVTDVRPESRVPQSFLKLMKK
jgi:hypothetical protein